MSIALDEAHASRGRPAGLLLRLGKREWLHWGGHARCSRGRRLVGDGADDRYQAEAGVSPGSSRTGTAFETAQIWL